MGSAEVGPSQVRRVPGCAEGVHFGGAGMVLLVHRVEVWFAQGLDGGRSACRPVGFERV